MHRMGFLPPNPVLMATQAFEGCRMVNNSTCRSLLGTADNACDFKSSNCHFFPHPWWNWIEKECLCLLILVFLPSCHPPVPTPALPTYTDERIKHMLWDTIKPGQTKYDQVKIPFVIVTNVFIQIFPNVEIGRRLWDRNRWPSKVSPGISNSLTAALTLIEFRIFRTWYFILIVLCLHCAVAHAQWIWWCRLDWVVSYSDTVAHLV